MNNNSKRKSRSNTGRLSRARGPEKILSADGIYNNAHFMHAITKHIGDTVLIQTQNGLFYEGVFKTFSGLFEIVVEMAHKVDPDNPLEIIPDQVFESLVFKPQSVISIEIRDADLEFATRETFQTDTAISKFNGQIGERELEPWEGAGCSNGDEFDLAEATANGWDVNDMFRKNEQIYGVTSTFDHLMPGYTTQLQNRDSKDYKDAEAKAAKIANEIENNPCYKARIETENGDEEERFASVARPNQLCMLDNNCNGNGGISENANYIVPGKRKNLPVNKVSMRSGAGTVTTSPPSTLQYAKPPVHPVSAAGYHNSPPIVSPVTQLPPFLGPPVIAVTSTPITTAVVTNTSTAPAYPKVQPLPQRDREQKFNGQVESSQTPHQSKPQAPLSNIKPVSRSYTANGKGRFVSEPRISDNGTNQQAAHLGPCRPSDKATQPAANTSLGPAAGMMVHSNTHAIHPAALMASPHHGPPAPFPPAPFPSSPVATPFPLTQTQGIQQEQNKLLSKKSPSVPQPEEISAPVHQERPRHRDEHLSDLRKFSSDFKLSEPIKESKKPPQQSAQTDDSDVEQNVKVSSENDLQLIEMDKVASVLKQSTLNPNAKEFVYNPNAKPFAPRTYSTPTSSRPHTPLTPSYCPAQPSNTVQGPAPGMPTMIMPTTYVLTTTQPTYHQPPNQGNRFRKVQMTMSHRPDIASQMQVAAATGQPLLAPAPMHSQFAVPYSPHGHIAPQPFHQMLRMVPQQGGGMVPLVPTAINYHRDSPPAQTSQLQYMGPPHTYHPHHHAHPPPNMTPSPGPNGGPTAQSQYQHTPQSPVANYLQPPPLPHAPNGPPTHSYPVMCLHPTPRLHHGVPMSVNNKYIPNYDL